ncbi:MAG: reverse transcriptase family protein [Pedobacter sp.]|nr:reverse transcriptase family protein [Pedobacter sp.]
MTLDKPYYPNSPIKNIQSLADFLQVNEAVIKKIAANPAAYYNSFPLESERPDGTKKIRNISDPKPDLKLIQRRLVDRLFSKVEFPLYLTGGIRDDSNPRDYVLNAAMHCGAYVVISNDIKNFFPSVRKKLILEIFKHFFHFPSDVSELLAQLVTLDNYLPQGAPTSSYLANLVFFDIEYQLVSYFRSRELIYSRLIDDIVVSSKKRISKEQIEDVITRLSRMVRGKGCKLHAKKKTIVSRSTASELMYITGLWINNGSPRVGVNERKIIRALVSNCEHGYKVDPTSNAYHAEYNSVSGKVAKLTRLGHVEADSMRATLSKRLPLLSESDEKKLVREVKRVSKYLQSHSLTAGARHRLDKINYKLTILARSNRIVAGRLRADIRRAVSIAKAGAK